MMTDKHLEPERIWHPDTVVLDDMRVSKDAADFLTFYGRDVDEIHKGLFYVFSTMPPNRPELMKNWERVAARIGEIITTGRKRPN